MTDLLELADQLQDTNAAIATMERELATAPLSEGAGIALRSLEHRRAVLEKQFAQEANIQGIDIFRYTIARDEPEFPVSALADSLKSFQSWLTVVFDAIKTKTAKRRARVSADIAALTTLDFGYAYPGSRGFVLTVPNERLLLIDSDLDQAVVSMFQMLKAESSEEILSYAQQVGVASVNLMYQWVRNNSEYALAADIQWRRNDEVRQEILFQPEQALNLKTIIERTSEEEQETISVISTLQGGDVQTRSFHLSSPEADDVRGRLGETFVEPGDGLVLGNTYRAELLKRTVLYYATGEEEVSWVLIRLTPL
jgi:hypothetical protein